MRWGRNLYVGNLPYEIGETELQELFSRAGSVESVNEGHGFIRVTNGREIFFHRSDVCEGTSFNDFIVSDAVTFELLDDRISGARALRVRRHRSHRGNGIYCQTLLS